MNLDHLFIDLAVTNPNPSIGQIIAIAAVRTDKKGQQLGSFAAKVKLEEPLSSAEETECAYSDVEWRSARRFEHVMEDLQVTLITPFDPTYVAVATHAEVDRSFLREASGNRAFKRSDISKLLTRSWLDPLQLAWPMVYNDMITDRSFVSLCKHFKVENSAPDTATGDVAALVEVYWAMMSRYRGALLGEEVARELGGKALATVRRWTGL